MDTTDPDITFDSNGQCNHCNSATKLLKLPPYGLSPIEKEKALNSLISNIRNSSKNNKYDCVIGLSGGVDSSYLAYLVNKWELRPIVVHLDNHWNSDIANQNINNICNILKFKEIRKVLNWEEFKDLQLSFLEASTPDLEIPSDNGINALLWDTAKEYGIKYILAGTNTSSESILPNSWSQGHIDKKYINSIYKQYGKFNKLSFHILSFWEVIWNKRILNIKFISLLDYVNYDKEKAKEFISRELGWKDYGRKHGESDYTRIIQEFILPVKFGFDKRKAHFSSLIIAGQMTRDEALKKLSEPLYPDKKAIQNDINILCDKLDITNNDFDQIMALPVKTINNYPNLTKTLQYKIYCVLKFFVNNLIKK